MPLLLRHRICPDAALVLDSSPCGAYPRTHCELECVTWNASTYVSSLVLKEQGLKGKVCDSLAKLERLAKLDLSENQLVGTLPERIGPTGSRTGKDKGLKALRYLGFGGNNMTGPIPVSYAYLDLTYFSVAPNAKLCGTDWLGAVNLPRGRGSKVTLLFPGSCAIVLAHSPPECLSGDSVVASPSPGAGAGHYERHARVPKRGPREHVFRCWDGAGNRLQPREPYLGGAGLLWAVGMVRGDNCGPDHQYHMVPAQLGRP